MRVVVCILALALVLASCGMPEVAASRPVWRDPQWLDPDYQAPEEQIEDPEHDPEYRSLYTPVAAPMPEEPVPEAKPTPPEPEDIDLSAYPASLQAFYKRYPQVRQYVLDYFEYKDVDFEIDLSDLAGCEEVPLLLQWDKRWGYRPYNGSMMGPSGCGPTALSMAAIYLTGDTSLDPYTLAQFAVDNGYANPSTGTQWTLFSSAPKKLGMNTQQITTGQEDIARHLKNGDVIAVNVRKGYFTYSGHFILLVGLTEDGQYIIRDPNSEENTNKTWSHEDIVDQFKALWALSKAN